MTEDAHEEAEAGRITSPMQDYDGTAVIVGMVVLSIGLFLTFGLPYLF